MWYKSKIAEEQYIYQKLSEVVDFCNKESMTGCIFGPMRALVKSWRIQVSKRIAGYWLAIVLISIIPITLFAVWRKNFFCDNLF